MSIESSAASSIELPQAARDYFDAANAHDIDRTLAPFADHATVEDEGAHIAGRPAIREWIARTMKQYGVTARPERIEHGGGVAAVTALVTGNFPGSPARLTYRFGLEHDRIVRLEIR